MSYSILKDKIIAKYGAEIRYAKDCDVLADIISNETKQLISGSTLKRLFGIIPGVKEPRLYTLDLISKYIGYANYDDFVEQIQTNESSKFESFQEININNLKTKEKIKFEYEPERLIIAEYESESQFRILESVNSKLKVNDIIKFNQIVLNYPLFINEVIRDNEKMGAYTAGTLSGNTSLEKMS
jgi:hypothetical protein